MCYMRPTEHNWSEKSDSICQWTFGANVKCCYSECVWPSWWSYFDPDYPYFYAMLKQPGLASCWDLGTGTCLSLYMIQHFWAILQLIYLITTFHKTYYIIASLDLHDVIGKKSMINLHVWKEMPPWNCCPRQCDEVDKNWGFPMKLTESHAPHLLHSWLSKGNVYFISDCIDWISYWSPKLKYCHFYFPSTFPSHYVTFYLSVWLC